MTQQTKKSGEEAFRTHHCGDIDASLVGEPVRLAGWVDSRRDHGGVYFFDLRDRSGFVQVVARPQQTGAFSVAEKLGSEHVVCLTGVVMKRPAGSENPKLPTGMVEVEAAEIELLNPCPAIPFEIDERSHASEEVRFKYRFLDLRRPQMQKNLALRYKASYAARRHLDGLGFWEIETPALTKSTPEGARDYLVPSRVNPGTFYALPQSPQIFKQILMASGMERYYQFARCFRDEDLRADRQPEHTQIDMEMSFVRERDIHAAVEGIVGAVFKAAIDFDLPTPFPSLEYSDVMARFGSDKPDLRYALEIQDLSGMFKDSGFRVFGDAVRSGGVVRCLHASGPRVLSRTDLDKFTDLVKSLGAKGLAWMRFKGTELKVESPIAKFLSEEELGGLRSRFELKPDDVLLFGAGAAMTVSGHLGALRTQLIKKLELGPSKRWAPLWVKHFPLLEKDEDGGWTFSHNPFTAPLQDEIPKLDSDPGSVLSHQYDLVLNGTELGSGSIRNHRPDLQRKIFGLMGHSPEDQDRLFGLLLRALEYGAPPHGGIALGFDRLVAQLCGEDSIREVIAFPKTTKGIDILSDAPSEVSARQLKELHIKLDL